MSGRSRAAVVGGGLAGLAAAVALRTAGLDVELFEARRRLGGRASSYCDPTSGALVDYCQHVSMGCCTNLADFCRRTGIDADFRRDSTLHFFDPQGQRCDVAASRWLPAPLHLAPALARLTYLSLGERWRIMRTMWRLVRTRVADDESAPTMDQWLRRHGQSSRAIELFWDAVLVSALGETLDRVSVPAARKVFVEGFLAARPACDVLVPELPLGELYGERLTTHVTDMGVKLHLNASVAQVTGDATAATGIVLGDGTQRDFDYVVLALTWRHVCSLLPPQMLAAIPKLADARGLESSPITGIHLWFDRPILSLPHAVLVGCLSQWVFARGPTAVPQTEDATGYYYQVVISASRVLAGQSREEILQEIREDLTVVSRDVSEAKLLHAQIVTEKNAVFSPLPGAERLRPSQRTPIKNLALAGDWTATGWPSTMEGAIRSGYLAAEAILASAGVAKKFLVPDQNRPPLARLLLGKK